MDGSCRAKEQKRGEIIGFVNSHNRKIGGGSINAEGGDSLIKSIVGASGNGWWLEHLGKEIIETETQLLCSR
jgi:hypothetical protein